MPLTISNYTGDGKVSTLISTAVELPDSGQTVNVAGTVQAVGKSAVSLTGSPLTAPAPPASGLIYWNIQVDVTTGAATVQQSTSADPAAINANNVVIFRQTLAPGQTNDALVATDQTPDTY